MTSQDTRKGPPAKRPRKQSEKTTKRPCMTCRREFDSEGKHNRMCSYCAAKGDYGMPSRVIPR